MTQFLADLNVNCDNKKKNWAAYMNMAATEDLLADSKTTVILGWSV